MDNFKILKTGFFQFVLSNDGQNYNTIKVDTKVPNSFSALYLQMPTVPLDPFAVQDKSNIYFLLKDILDDLIKLYGYVASNTNPNNRIPLIFIGSVYDLFNLYRVNQSESYINAMTLQQLEAGFNTPPEDVYNTTSTLTRGTFVTFNNNNGSTSNVLYRGRQVAANGIPGYTDESMTYKNQKYYLSKVLAILYAFAPFVLKTMLKQEVFDFSKVSIFSTNNPLLAYNTSDRGKVLYSKTNQYIENRFCVIRVNQSLNWNVRPFYCTREIFEYHVTYKAQIKNSPPTRDELVRNPSTTFYCHLPSSIVHIKDKINDTTVFFGTRYANNMVSYTTLPINQRPSLIYPMHPFVDMIFRYDNRRSVDQAISASMLPNALNESYILNETNGAVEVVGELDFFNLRKDAWYQPSMLLIHDATAGTSIDARLDVFCNKLNDLMVGYTGLLRNPFISQTLPAYIDKSSGSAVLKYLSHIKNIYMFVSFSIQSNGALDEFSTGLKRISSIVFSLCRDISAPTNQKFAEFCTFSFFQNDYKVQTANTSYPRAGFILLKIDAATKGKLISVASIEETIRVIKTKNVFVNTIDEDTRVFEFTFGMSSLMNLSLTGITLYDKNTLDGTDLAPQDSLPENLMYTPFISGESDGYSDYFLTTQGFFFGD